MSVSASGGPMSLPFFPPPEEWSAWLAEPAGTPYPWPDESESDDDAT